MDAAMQHNIIQRTRSFYFTPDIEGLRILDEQTESLSAIVTH